MSVRCLTHLHLHLYHTEPINKQTIPKGKGRDGGRGGG